MHLLILPYGDTKQKVSNLEILVTSVATTSLTILILAYCMCTYLLVLVVTFTCNYDSCKSQRLSVALGSNMKSEEIGCD